MIFNSIFEIFHNKLHIQDIEVVSDTNNVYGFDSKIEVRSDLGGKKYYLILIT